MLQGRLLAVAHSAENEKENRPVRENEFQTVAKVGDIPEGEGRAYVVGGKLVAVFNDGAEYHAIDDICPHMGASLAQGALLDGTVICSWHHWRFSICDGTWVDNPKLKIDAYDVRIEGDEIQVRLRTHRARTED